MTEFDPDASLRTPPARATWRDYFPYILTAGLLLLGLAIAVLR